MSIKSKIVPTLTMGAAVLVLSNIVACKKSDRKPVANEISSINQTSSDLLDNAKKEVEHLESFLDWGHDGFTEQRVIQNKVVNGILVELDLEKIQKANEAIEKASCGTGSATSNKTEKQQIVDDLKKRVADVRRDYLTIKEKSN